MQVPVIRNDEDLREAIAVTERLWGAPEGTPEGDRLDALATLIDAYEARRWPSPAGDPVDVLRFVMEEGGRSQAELGAILGSRSRASEILSRRRALTVQMIHAIATAWKIPADLLIRPYPLDRVA